MKLILTHEVAGLGTPGDIVDVKDGYGRNFLLPRGVAMRWSRGAAKQIESIKKARATRAVHDFDQADAIRVQLEKDPVTVPVQSGKAGRLFGAVTVSDIAAALQTVGVEVDKRRIEVGNPIKSLGAHTVSVRVHSDVVARVTLNVVAA